MNPTRWLIKFNLTVVKKKCEMKYRFFFFFNKIEKKGILEK